MSRPPIWSDFHSDAIRAVAVAYRSRMNAGKVEWIAHNAAVRAYLRFYPDTERLEASHRVYQMIGLVIAQHGKWFNSGQPPYQKIKPPEAGIDDLPEG